MHLHLTGTLSTLKAANGQSVDCIAFSPDGQFIAAGGQDGQVRIWSWRERELIITLERVPAWIDRLAWSPTSNHLAFSSGRYVQVWDADINEIAVTLNFDHSSVLDLDWHPDGRYLAISGYQGVKIWNSQEWDDDPDMLVVPSASLAIAWSPDGKYIASGNMDRTIIVLEWNNPHPWVMRGFPGKVRQLAWSKAKNKRGVPLLASSSAESIVVWSKRADDLMGWKGEVLERHTEMVQALAFEPNSFLLASAANDGLICFWHQAKRLSQMLNSAPYAGFSCLAWHPQGQKLAAGCQDGKWLIWAKAERGQGFSQL